MRPSNFDDLTGRRFNRLVVVGYDPATVRGRTKWLCQCDCGGTVSARATHLKRGETQSCGCLQKERTSVAARTSNLVHGLYKHPLYRVWCGMIQRCYNPNIKKFKDWGGRGIRVCDEWRKSPEAFIHWGLANGYEKGLILDRYPDNDGNYEPSNCRWATWKQSQRNRRSSRIVEMGGVRLNVSEWAEITGVERHTIYERLDAGWDVTRALTLPSTIPRK